MRDHKPMKVSGSIGGRPGRWVCSCGEAKTLAGSVQVWQVKASFKEHAATPAGNDGGNRG